MMMSESAKKITRRKFILLTSSVAAGTVLYVCNPTTTETPRLVDIGNQHFVFCHRATELTLQGVPEN
jgi:hypothetical protein